MSDAATTNITHGHGHTHGHRHGCAGCGSGFLMHLLGFDRFTKGRAVDGLAMAGRAANPFDLGLVGNCRDFWTAGRELGVEYDKVRTISFRGLATLILIHSCTTCRSRALRRPKSVGRGKRRMRAWARRARRARGSSWASRSDARGAAGVPTSRSARHEPYRPLWAGTVATQRTLS